MQVFGGGPVLTANPEPYADFFDVVLLGDGEEMLNAFTDRLVELKQQLAAPSSGERAGLHTMAHFRMACHLRPKRCSSCQAHNL